MRWFKSIRYLCVIALLGGVFWTPRAGAATDEFTQYETDLLDKINEARRNPAQAAADVEDVVITKSLNDALCEIQASGLLTTTASNHTLEMADQHYYGYTSLDGRSPEARILDIGYNAALTGEMLGLVTFRNYMPPDTAVNILFKQLLKRDLQQFEAGGDTYIFNPDITEIGIALTAGRVEIGNGIYNGYILTCDFGTPASDPKYGIQSAEFLFIDLVNKIRTEPVETLAEFGFDILELAEEKPGIAEMLNNGMTPISYAPSFRETAFDTNKAVYDTIFTGPDGLVVISPKDHCAESLSDCFAISVELSAGFQSIEKFPDEEIVYHIFEKLLIQELAAEDLSEMLILNPGIQEISSIFSRRQINSGGQLVQQYVLTSAFGKGYLSLIEKQSLNLLNQARAENTKPLFMEEDSEVTESDMETSEQPFVDEEAPKFITDPLPPLTANHLIYASADQHAREMIEYTYFSKFSYDGELNSGDRFELAGYPTLKYYEAIDIALEEAPFDFDTAGASMYENILDQQDQEFTNSLIGLDYELSGLYEPEMRSAGIRFLYSVPVTEIEDTPDWNPSGFQKLYSLLVIVDVAAPDAEQTEGVVVSLVYEDADLDGKYDRGEELPAVPVEIYQDESQESFRFYTDNSGCLSLPMSAGAYEFVVGEGEESQIMTVDMENENLLLTFPVRHLLESSADDETVEYANDLLPAGADETIVNIN